jgi:hypothetical protein
MSVVDGVKTISVVAKPAAWLWRKLRPDTSENALESAAAQLAADVERIERTRLEQLQVSPGTGIPLQFGDLAAVENIGSDALSRGSLLDVGPYYLGLTTPRRLLVVGEPGSGKTVLILHLILRLARSRRVATDPVPVRVNATSWDGQTNLADFLVEKLSDQYSLHKRTARALVDNDRILPVIDGLDEMDAADEAPQRAEAAVARFNETPWRARPLVVTCRSRVYEAVRRARDGAGIVQCEVVSMRPLSSDEIAEHVQTLLDDGGSISESHGHRLTPLLEKLAAEPTGVLAHTLRTPWMFTLAMTYLERVDEEAAARLIEADTSARIADLLFAAQIPTACGHQPGEPSTWRYSEPEVQNWMRTLASHLSRDSSKGSGRTEIALHQIWLLAGERRTKLLHRLAVGLAVGLAVAIGLGSGVAVGLAVGLAFEMAAGIAAREPMPAPERVVFRTRRKGAMRARLVGGLELGLPLGFAFGWVSVWAAGLVSGLLSGLAVGLTGGLAVGLTGVPRDLRPPREANREIHDDLVAMSVWGLAWGLVGGLGGGGGGGGGGGFGGGVWGAGWSPGWRSGWSPRWRSLSSAGGPRAGTRAQWRSSTGLGPSPQGQ